MRGSNRENGLEQTLLTGSPKVSAAGGSGEKRHAQRPRSESRLQVPQIRTSQNACRDTKSLIISYCIYLITKIHK